MINPHLTSAELFWRAANYLTVGMLYLKGNPLLREELRTEHCKGTILGHWGACPAINAVYAHVSDLSRRTDQRIRLVVGSGHAGPAILACLYLEGSLERFYPQFSRNLAGLTKLFDSFGSTDGFSTEITADYPGAIYSGGELGAALAVSQGYAMRNPESFCVCVIGDGELETSVTQAAWQGFRFLSDGVDGRVLPVINANGYKMGSRSLQALQSRREQVRLLKGYGLFPIFVGGDHAEIAAAFDLAFTELTKPKRSRQPVIVLDTPKGWTGPSSFGSCPFAGTVNAHKPILKRPAFDVRELKMIEAWLLSYRPAELFDCDGTPRLEISECLLPKGGVLGMAHQFCRREWSAPPVQVLSYAQPIEAVTKILASRIQAGDDLMVFSPDELGSNRLNEVLGCTDLKYGGASAAGFSGCGQVLEILNEHLCYAWSQGFSAAGHHPVLVSFEAFAPVLDSMLSQHLKFLKRCAQTLWRTPAPALNVILTSLGWYNTPTHHNPGCVDNLLGRKLQHVRLYMPVTASAAALFLNEMLDSVNRINLMVLNKHHSAKLSSIAAAIDGQAGRSWRVLATDGTDPAQISLIAIGDCMAEESLFAKEIINERCPRFSVQVIAVERLNCLEVPEDPERTALLSAIRNSSCRVFVYNGYPTTIHGLLWEMGLSADTIVLGFHDEDHTPSGVSRLVANQVSRFHIAEEAARLCGGLAPLEERESV